MGDGNEMFHALGIEGDSAFHKSVQQPRAQFPTSTHVLHAIAHWEAYD